MNCAEFQKVLPYIIETGGNAEEEAHLRDCHVCSDLVADLKYIAEQAKLLVPMVDPDPRVWTGIQNSLEREGLVKKTTRARGRLLNPKSWGAVPWIALAAAVALVIGAAVMFNRTPASSARVPAISTSPAAGSSMEDDDQFLRAVAARNPALRSTYEENLRRVNASIEDARRAVQADPADSDARADLRRAYQQKSMMYDLALQSER